MDRRTSLAALSIVMLMWVAAVAVVSAEEGAGHAGSEPGLVSGSAPRRNASQTVSVAALLRSGPARFCPGWNLYYTLLVTNTSDSLPLTDLIITDTLPPGTWLAAEELTGTIPGEYLIEPNAVEWRGERLAAGDSVRAELRLRTFSYLENQIPITNTFLISATELEAVMPISSVLVVDSRLCEPTATATPTASATPTVTLTPTTTPTATTTPIPTRKPRLCVPLIFKSYAANP